MDRSMDDLANAMRTASEQSSGHCPSSEIDWYAIAAAVRAYLLSDEAVERAAAIIAMRDGGAEWSQMSDRAKLWDSDTARAALSSAIGGEG